MAQTTSQVNACNAVLKLDNSEGNLADISGSSNRVSITLTNIVSEPVRTFGSQFGIRTVCGKDSSITLRVVYSEDESEAKQVLLDWYQNHNQDSRTFQVDNPDSEAGSDRFTFECKLGEMTMDLDPSEPGPTMIEAQLRPTGTFSWAEIGS